MWLDDYVDYASKLTDAPQIFHVAAGLTALSTAIGNGASFETWGNRYHPTLWVILVSPSGWFRKSTAINIMTNMLRKAGLAERILPSRTSYEKLISLLAEQPSRLLAFGEFSGFLADLSRSYNDGTKEDLTEMFDGCSQFVRETISGGKITIKSPSINLIGASVIDWMLSRVQAGDLRSGFLARFIYVVAREKETWHGLSIERLTNEENQLSMKLKAISSMTAYVERTISLDKIKQQADAWARDMEKKEVDDALFGIISRIYTYALKIAAIIALSELRETVLPDDWDWAQSFASYAYDQAVDMFRNELAENRFQVNLNRVRRKIYATPGISRRELVRNFHLPTKQLDDILDTLSNAGEIRVEIVKRSGPSTEVYYPTEPH